jgi:hypothetical protein
MCDLNIVASSDFSDFFDKRNSTSAASSLFVHTAYCLLPDLPRLDCSSPELTLLDERVCMTMVVQRYRERRWEVVEHRKNFRPNIGLASRDFPPETEISRSTTAGLEMQG